MANNGRDYETFVQKIQQALINSEEYLHQKNISIERNVKITDNCGIYREFDLYWEYELAGVTYKTVIECKDYASKISIDKIDSLIGKIRDIPDIKPIFATKTGYQSGAEQKAKHNKIELLIIREQIDDDWKDKDGNSLIKEIYINMLIQSPAHIKAFSPKLDKDWIEQNTDIDISKPISMDGLTNEIFIKDNIKNEQYSIFDLEQRLTNIKENEYGDMSKVVEFKDGYISYKDTMLKIDSYKVDYIISKPYSMPIVIDYAKELIGVIEYVSRETNTSTAVFKDRIIKNWNK
ncbi:MAG: restriction endonuclease [Arcobacteraceae bacterium]